MSCLRRGERGLVKSADRAGCGCPRRRLELGGVLFLEVLLAMLISSAGLLVFLQLQASAARAVAAAYHRSVATQLSIDAVERLHANPAGYLSLGDLTAEAKNHPACVTTIGCADSELAESDLAELQRLATALLPRGTLVLCGDSTPDDGTPAAAECDGLDSAAAVKIWWNSARDGEGLSRLAIAAGLLR